MSNSLAFFDWIVITGYFLLLLAVAAWVISKKQRTSVISLPEETWAGL